MTNEEIFNQIERYENYLERHTGMDNIGTVMANHYVNALYNELANRGII